MTQPIVPDDYGKLFDIIFEDFLGMAAYFAQETGAEYWRVPLNKYAEFLMIEFQERLDKKEYKHPKKATRVADSTSSSASES